MKSCGICSHPERAAIDAAMVDGASLRAISGQFGTSKSALDRHRKCIPAALTKAKQASEVADAETLLSRVEGLMSRFEGIYNLAIASGKLSDSTGALREVRYCIELLAKLTGELQPAGVNIRNVNIQAAFEGVTIESLSDEELEFLWKKLVPDSTTFPEILRTANLFDEVTLPPYDLEGQRRHLEILRQCDAQAGKPPRGWLPGVTSTAPDRFRMFLAAWKRMTDEDLPDTVDMRSLGDSATIRLEFDLKDGSRWPLVYLWYEAKEWTSKRPGSPVYRALGPRTIEAVK
jgi:hypothetical protein